jgi:hypothetical protein
VQNELSERFNINSDLQQGDIISSQLFNLCLEKVIRNIDINPGGTIYNRMLQLLAYAEDVDLMARNTARLAKGFVELEVAACRAGLIVNEKKTKCMINTREEHRYSDITCFAVNQYQFDRAAEFKYLGSNLTEKNENKIEIKA